MTTTTTIFWRISRISLYKIWIACIIKTCYILLFLINFLFIVFLICLSLGGIPHAYTLLARDFYNLIQEHEQTEHISVHEYVRDKWTFHAKGLWYYFPNESLPSLTLVGSPNFGHRSVYRDLEAQVAIVTNNQGLNEVLHEEKTYLYNSTQCVNSETFMLPERKIPVWVYCVTRLIKNFLWHMYR